MDALYLVYLGEREGAFTVNSIAHPRKKLRVTPGVPFAIDDGDRWIAGLGGFYALIKDRPWPAVERLPMADESYCTRHEGAFLEGLAASCPDPARLVEIEPAVRFNWTCGEQLQYQSSCWLTADEMMAYVESLFRQHGKDYFGNIYARKAAQ